MKRFTLALYFIVLWLFINQLGVYANTHEIVIVMSGPSVTQIKNIENLFEKNILSVNKIRLVCIYHQKEKIFYSPSFSEEIITDYSPSFEYVKKNNLHWVGFKAIKGEVTPLNIFKQNEWTSQFKEIFNQSHGIIFTGGSDIPPYVYGEETKLLTSALTHIRSLLECSFLFHLLGGSQNPNFVPFLAARKDYPVLGICAGAQTMNVACGGNLYQDIPSEIFYLNTFEQVLKLSQEKIHSARYLKKLHPLTDKLMPAIHRIKIRGNSIFVQQMSIKTSENPMVISNHHQAIKTLGKDLYITATSMEGKVIESIEHRKFRNVLGVQFHPERFTIYKKGEFYKPNPHSKADFNIRTFFLQNPPSMKFHTQLWKWFSGVLQSQK
jgi:putative glutamine amidotransferase